MCWYRRARAPPDLICVFEHGFTPQPEVPSLRHIGESSIASPRPELGEYTMTRQLGAPVQFAVLVDAAESAERNSHQLSRSEERLSTSRRAFATLVHAHVVARRASKLARRVVLLMSQSLTHARASSAASHVGLLAFVRIAHAAVSQSPTCTPFSWCSYHCNWQGSHRRCLGTFRLCG